MMKMIRRIKTSGRLFMMGELARFFDAIADKKGCDYEIDNPVFMGG